MSPQFVDFDGDGQGDIVAGTFSGSPHLALGSKTGFAQPSQILDAEGRRIVLNQFWNYETKEWDSTTRCDVRDAQVPEGHATSAVAFDWDADGDPDLLLGDYKTGRIYRRMNEGKPGAPLFAGVNLPVLRDGQPLGVPASIETMRMVDWDRDGSVDLLCGSVEARRSGELAGVYWLRNAGRRGEPSFDAPRALVTGQLETLPGNAQPWQGFYPDAGDVDGDGDLDLVVGAKGRWKAAPRELTSAERARLAELEAELTRLGQAIDGYYEQLDKDLKGLDKEAAQARSAEIWEARRSEIEPMFRRRTALEEEQDGLTFGKKEGYFVWLYENLGDR